MTHTVSIQQLYELHQKQLKLEWVSGQQHDISIIPDSDDKDDEVLAGYFNSVHPNQIQIIGRKELAYFSALDKTSLYNIFNAIDARKPLTFIVANEAEVPKILLDFVKAKKIALLTSAAGGETNRISALLPGATFFRPSHATWRVHGGHGTRGPDCRR